VGYSTSFTYTIYEPQNPKNIFSMIFSYEKGDIIENSGTTTSNQTKIIKNTHNSLELIRPEDNPQIWENFEGEYFAYNAPFQLEKSALGLKKMVEKHKYRYENDKLKNANYIFFTGNLLSEKDRLKFQRRLNNFIEFMKELYKEIPKLLEKKLKIFFVKGEFPNITFFIGKKMSSEYGIIYFHNEVFMNNDVPTAAFVTKDIEIIENLRNLFEKYKTSSETFHFSIVDIIKHENFFEDLINHLKNPFRIREILTNFKTSATLAINEKVNQLRKKGIKVFHLGFGESPFPVHPIIQEALIKNSDKNQYLPTVGLESLRTSALQYFASKFNLDVNKFSIIIGPGSKELIFDIQLAVEGDLILPVPSWVSYEPQARILRDRVIKLDTEKVNNFFPSAEQLRNIIVKARKSGKKPKKIILNYPNNPTGYTLRAKEIEKLSEVCREFSILVISDEIYGLLNYSNNHRSFAEFYPEGTIVTTGVSKHLSIGGYRLGIAIIPKSLINIFETIKKIGSETWSTTSAPIQYACLEAFKNNPEIENYIEACTKIHSHVSKFAIKSLRKIGIEYTNTEGGFYIYPDFGKYKEELSKYYNVSDSEGLSIDLFNRINLATIPGTQFGENKEKLRVRLALCNYDGKFALENFVDDENNIDEFIKNNCPNIYEAFSMLEKYFKFELI